MKMSFGIVRPSRYNNIMLADGDQHSIFEKQINGLLMISGKPVGCYRQFPELL